MHPFLLPFHNLSRIAILIPGILKRTSGLDFLFLDKFNNKDLEAYLKRLKETQDDPIRS